MERDILGPNCPIVDNVVSPWTLQVHAMVIRNGKTRYCIRYSRVQELRVASAFLSKRLISTERSTHKHSKEPNLQPTLNC